MPWDNPDKAWQIAQRHRERWPRGSFLAGLDPPRRVAELALPVAPAKKRRSPAKKAAKAPS